MLIGQNYRLDHFLVWGIRLAWVVSAAAFLGIFFLCRVGQDHLQMRDRTAGRKIKQTLSYEAIGTGSLSLNAARSSQFLPRLIHELVLIARNTRPDAPCAEPCILVGSKATGEERCIKVGENLYLSELDREKEGRRGLRFSSTESSMWIKPVSFNRSNVTFEAYRFLEEEKKEEKAPLVLSPSQEQMSARGSTAQKEGAAFVKAMREARHCGRDRLLETYGGESFRALKEKEKVQFGEGENSYVCFVSSGDLLQWHEGRWRQILPSEVSASEPVAQVKTASLRGVEIELWDETGFFRLPIRVEMLAARHMSKEAPLFTSIRLRNGSQVTCIAGKRRLVLREGDWLLKTSSGWRNLRRLEQIEDCIHHRLIGELFIFDGLETVQGKTVMKGHLFDAMRTEMQAVSFATSLDKKPAKSKERRGRR